NPDGTQLAAVAGALDTAEGQTWIGRYRCIHENLTRFDSIDKSLRFFSIVRPDARAQPERRVIRDLDSFSGVFRPKEHRHRAKKFFPIDGRPARDVGQHRGHIEVTS